jgi:hypothetical protein
VGGFLKKLLLICSCLALFAFAARTAQIAFIALSTDSWADGSALPAGWQIKVNHGKPDISQSQDSNGPVLHLRSRHSSFGVERSIDVDPVTLPWLTWRWKVSELPAGGDFRYAHTDDQAAQILVAFSDHHILTYIWDTTAPRGTMQSASAIPLVHIFAVVCRSGSSELNQWVSESRNVTEDFQRAYGHTPPRVKGLRLQINSQHTATSAESYFGQVVFRDSPQ